MRVRLTHRYNVAPARLWDLVTDYGALHQVCRPMITFDGVPTTGHVQQGDQIDCTVRLFGRLPPQPYRMKVLSCDPNAMRFVSSERGAGVKTWRHSLQVAPDGQGAILTEVIEIDAGPLTPLFALWARVLYRSRHKPRLEILGPGNA